MLFALNSQDTLPQFAPFTEETTLIYRVIRSRMTNDDLAEYVTYGIQLSRNGCILSEINDISTDFQAVCALADQCTRLELSPVHFPDVIEDFILT